MKTATVQDLLVFDKGDILKLSDTQTQAEFGQLSISLKILQKRVYKHPGIGFVYTCYVAEAPNEQKQSFMLMIKEVGGIYDTLMFYLDNEGLIKNTPLLNLDKSGLSDKFSTFYEDIEVPWVKQGPTIFGVEICEDSKGTDLRTIGNYKSLNTSDNPDLFLEWTGDADLGYFESWVGSTIQLSDFELLKVSKQQ